MLKIFGNFADYKYFFLTQKEYISLLKNPENVYNTHISDLRIMLEAFPFLVSARVLLAMALKKLESVEFPLVAQQTALYVADRRWFYFFLFPEKLCKSTVSQSKNQSSGEYFDMLEKIERSGQDTRQSLRMLAEKLMAARQDFSVKKSEIMNEAQSTENQQVENNFYWQQKENDAKKLIAEKKYSDALEILYQINLNIPKKSIYFADQIRFLTKIIQISNNK